MQARRFGARALKLAVQPDTSEPTRKKCPLEMLCLGKKQLSKKPLTQRSHPTLAVAESAICPFDDLASAESSVLSFVVGFEQVYE